ncbi:ABC transporter G family member 48-like [Daucus carota subsp. sativus]|uniref:ABC transporter G family member 48-like n=1 Tax=Daucus carota subsp. sativus TaxID=79200 RepID=UPI003082D8B7
MEEIRFVLLLSLSCSPFSRVSRFSNLISLSPELVGDFSEEIIKREKLWTGVADFLQEVTSKHDQKQCWLHKDEPYRYVTAQEFSKAYLSFHKVM